VSELRGVAGRLAAAIADGEPVHWSNAESLARSAREQSLLKQLRAIAWLERQNSSARSTFVTATATEPWLWSAAVALAAIQLLVAIPGLLLAGGFDLLLRVPYQFAIALSFGLAAR